MLRISPLPLLLLAVPANAQDNTPAAAPTPDAAVAAPGAVADASAPAADDAASAGPNQILVVATRLKGEVDAPQPPVAKLDETDIAALGASSLTDVLSRISPQSGSGRGRGSGQPVILVNGQRITNFREMRNYPPESLKRIEILPEEVALRYGYPPDARVINFILKDNFKSRSFEGQFGVPTRGGFSTWQGEASQLRISGPRRLNVTATVDGTSALFENERDITPSYSSTTPGVTVTDIAANRSLIASSRDYSLNTSWSTGLGKDGKAGTFSLNNTLTRNDSHGYSGLNIIVPSGGGAAVAAGPLDRISQTTTAQGGAGLNTFLGKWQFSATLDASHSEGRTLIDRSGSSDRDRVLSNSDSVTSLVTLIGRPLHLPAGDVSTTLKSGFAWSSIDSSDTRSSVGPVSLQRGDFSVGGNLGIPLTSRRNNVLPGVGDLTLNFSAGWDHLSDFGSLTDWSAGLTWGLTEKLGLQASYIINDAAPSLGNLGNPQSLTYNVPFYDLARGETSIITVTSGGNPFLSKERQRDIKLGANWQLPFLSNSNMIVEYFKNRSTNVTASFPLLTPAIEAAFPGRAVRDLSGKLIALDQRPVTLAEQNGSRLRWGFNLSGPIGKPSADGGMFGMMGGGGGPRRGGPGGGRPGGGARGGGGGGGGGPMMGGGQGRWNISLYHTVQFTSRVLVAPGGPVLDLLNGDALGSGGTPRHSLEFNGGFFNKGLGLFAQGTWAAPTTVRASGLPGVSDLRFGALAKVNMFLFADLGQQKKLVKAAPFFKGARMSLRFENLFDAHQKVTDNTGAVPLSYQPDYLDPRGRVISLEFRKMF